jgi:hypothetical protein
VRAVGHGVLRLSTSTTGKLCHALGNEAHPDFHQADGKRVVGFLERCLSALSVLGFRPSSSWMMDMEVSPGIWLDMNEISGSWQEPDLTLPSCHQSE